jgi:protein involved in polysaccharide export with SLBB domain
MPYNGAIARGSVRVALCIMFSFAMVTPAFASVHPGDELQVTVYNAPDLSRKVTVDAGGFVSLPLAGNVDVRGLEPNQIAERIGRALDPYFISKAAVSVETSAQTASVFVSGGPGGVLKYVAGETLTAALAELSGPADKDGGLAALARSRVDLHRVSIARDNVALGPFDAASLLSNGQGGPELQPGDTISLVDKPVPVRVLGDVVAPGTAYLATDEALSDALDQVGGVKLTAASASLTLQRGGTTTSVALGGSELAQPAQSGDVLTVPTAPLISVVGLVDKPGTVALKSNFTLLNAIYQAGGPAKRADLSRVQLVHDGTPHYYDIAGLTKGNTSQNPVLADGDLVFVPESRGFDFSQIFQGLVPLLYLVPRP